ncbi:toll/interleukin-1 receptor domain-containing protein [Kordiimonas lacus]|uniref:MTH538 TIR-like domain n=1 Tax=Kordiimonas lacus TaxID=637679 RepID=A0A1G6YLV4_9PROT|nr:toll/interleukin-1 receptor domain-containing protein [Kordiimonas lacus]SDD90625.1 MTH538 TIR-like domain [Kordiimonas lacus]
MSVTEFRYKAFISYSHADKAWAEWLLKSLESYRIPKNLVGRATEIGEVPARLAPIFRDRDELPAAHRLTDRLFEALRASEFLIVLCSPNSAKSKLVNREIIEFKKTHGDGRILCMIVDGVPFADDPEKECFPEALLHSFRADGSRGGLSAEGLAADIRAEGDGRSMGLLKIVAGLIGVGLNDLVRRDEQRRQRNMIAVAAASIVGMSVMGALTYEASTARDAAKQAQKLAEAKTQEAITNKNDVEDLLKFMMSESYYSLLAAGELSAAENLTRKTVEFFKNKDLNSLSDEGFSRMTGSMLKLGQTLDRKGESDRAKEMFDKTLVVSRRYYEHHPMREAAIFRLQNNLFFTGYLALRQGHFVDAERDYRERLALIRKYRANTSQYVPGDAAHLYIPTVWLEREADALMGLASLLAGPLGNLTEALPMHARSVELHKQIASLRENDNDSLTNLASAYHYAGHTYVNAGEFEMAEDAFKARLSLYDELTTRDPENYRIYRRYLISLENLGSLARIRGDLSEALSFQKAAAEGYDILVAKDPENTMWLGNSAQAYYELANMALQLEQVPLATHALKKSKAQITEALERDNSRTIRRLTSYRVAVLEAELLVRGGNTADAQALLAKTITALDHESDGYLRSNGALTQYANTHLAQGKLLAESGQMEAARMVWSKAMNALETTTATLSPDGKSKLAQIYTAMGDQGKAEHLLAQLDGIGFRDSSARYFSETSGSE